MRPVYLLILLLSLVSCKQRFYRTPSSSMEETLPMGKNFAVTLTDKFERNDIVVFNYYGPDYSQPEEEAGKFKMSWSKRVYRLIAYSGDSVVIKDGEVFIGGRHIALPPKGKMLYEVYAKDRIEEFEDGNFSSARRSGDTLIYKVSLTAEKAEEYRHRPPAFIGAKRILSDIISVDTIFARASVSGQWTVDNYGPFKIPVPGNKILVDDYNFNFYKNIPGITKGLNTISEKLYFVLGDNRYGAEDSRYIGLIAHSKMYGVVE